MKTDAGQGAGGGGPEPVKAAGRSARPPKVSVEVSEGPTREDLEQLRAFLERGLSELQAAREAQQRELGRLEALQADLREQVRHRAWSESLDADPGARALEELERLRGGLVLQPALEGLAQEVEASRRSWRESSRLAASVVGRLEAKVESLSDRLARDQEGESDRRVEVTGLLETVSRRVETLAVALVSLQERVGGLAEEVAEAASRAGQALAETSGSRELAGFGLRLEAAGASLASLAGRVEAMEASLSSTRGELSEQLSRCQDRIGAVEAREAPRPAGPSPELLDEWRSHLQDGLAALGQRLEAELHGLQARLVGLEARSPGSGSSEEGGGEVSRQRLVRLEERLEEELEAVAEQNRARVAELFDEAMGRIERATARLLGLEERSQEGARRVDACLEQVEALAGRLEALEVSLGSSRGELAEQLGRSRARLEVLEARVGEVAQGAATVESLRLALEGVRGDVELRCVEQALEAEAELEVIREQLEELAGLAGRPGLP